MLDATDVHGNTRNSPAVDAADAAGTWVVSLADAAAGGVAAVSWRNWNCESEWAAAVIIAAPVFFALAVLMDCGGSFWYVSERDARELLTGGVQRR